MDSQIQEFQVHAKMTVGEVKKMIEKVIHAYLDISIVIEHPIR
jgi:hypothetical protein